MQFLSVVEGQNHRSGPHLVQEVVVEQDHALRQTIRANRRRHKSIVLGAFQIIADNVLLVFFFQAKVKVFAH